MKPRILAVLLANLFAVAAANAQEGPFSLAGQVSVGGIGSDIDSRDESKAFEYRDLDSGGLLHFDIAGRGGRTWFDLFGENIGRRDQYADLNGGVYGLFKGRLYLNDIIHNHAFAARTPYTGVGGDTLTAPITGTGQNIAFASDPGTWNTYDAKIKRRNIGGYAEVSPGNAFYVRVDANETRWDGIRVIGSSNGPSPTYGFMDLPSPVDYVVRTVSAEGGYTSRAAHFSAAITRSKFTNDNDLLFWRNANAGGAMDTTPLPQDNEQTKFALNGVFKRLPLDSTLALRYVYAKTENSFPLLQSMLNTVHSATPTPTPTNVANFDGEIEHRTASASLTSQINRQLDTRVYWNRYEKENNSTDVVFVDQGLEPHIFSYEKNNMGVEVGYRLPRQTKLLVGFDYVDLDRDRADYDNTKDKKGYLEVKTGAWDIASVRAKVQHLQRRSNFLESDVGVNANDPLYLQRYVAKFDAANVDQDLFKLAVDFAPAPLLDVGIEAIVKRNDFKDTLLGRTNDKRRELYATVSYGDREAWRVTAFADAEWVRYDSLHRNISTVAGAAGFCATTNPNCFDPINGPSVAGSYNWSSEAKERNYSAGIGADVVASPRLKLNASYTWQKTRGSTDLTTPAFGGTFVVPTDVEAVDDVKIHTFHLKGTFQVTRNIGVTAGYAYEKYDYNDTAFQNYTYLVPGSTPDARAYLSGQYAFQNYKANIGYVFVTYRF